MAENPVEIAGQVSDLTYVPCSNCGGRIGLMPHNNAEAEYPCPQCGTAICPATYYNKRAFPEGWDKEMTTETVNTNDISDGYHTFGELYAHRIALYIALCKQLDNEFIPVWKSIHHSDGSIMPGWFVLGIHKEAGKQITYHLPAAKWDACEFAETLDRAPEWDGHTSSDVIERLGSLLDD